MFITSTPWVLLLEQESYLLYINLGRKNLDYKIYTTILKNHMQKVLDAILVKVATKNRTILHTFSTIRDVIDVSYKLNLALISLNFCEPFAE